MAEKIIEIHNEHIFSCLINKTRLESPVRARDAEQLNGSQYFGP